MNAEQLVLDACKRHADTLQNECRMTEEEQHYCMASFVAGMAALAGSLHGVPYLAEVKQALRDSLGNMRKAINPAQNRP